MESILNVALVIGVLILAYALIFRPRILTWGASEDEVEMPLIGDDLAHNISATRAISINAPIEVVWKWVIQLGADRGGFFSYTFLERALGYKMRDADIVPEFDNMEVGRVVSGSIDETNSSLNYNFPVVAVEPGEYFVLDGWGAFVLKEISPTQTRLIVRTHWKKTPSLLSKIDKFIGSALHYLMEGRMLIGFKAQSEMGSGVRLSPTLDYFWVLGLILSALGIASIVFFGEGVQHIFISIILGIFWLYAFLIINPRSIISPLLSLVTIATAVWLY